MTADHLKDVVGICRMVGGMPLALLLAASWVDVLSPAEIFSELQIQLRSSEERIGRICPSAPAPHPRLL